MKQILALAMVLLFSFATLSAQQSANFSVTDCGGQMHDLYAELDAGKVIVLCWVMPCSQCIAPSIISAKVAKNLQAVYGDKVRCYIIDDYGNTNCTSLQSWGSQFGISAGNGVSFISAKSIKMTDFGLEGMPKIVALGGTDHSVIYHDENTVDSLQLAQAMLTQLQKTTDVPLSFNLIPTFHVAPNPAENTVMVFYENAEAMSGELTMTDMTGRVVLRSAMQLNPNSKAPVNCSGLVNGTYFLRFTPTSSTAKHVLRPDGQCDFGIVTLQR